MFSQLANVKLLTYIWNTTGYALIYTKPSAFMYFPTVFQMLTPTAILDLSSGSSLTHKIGNIFIRGCRIMKTKEKHHLILGLR